MNQQSLLVLIILLLPLAGFAINGLLNKSISKGLVGVIAWGSILGSFLLSSFLVFQIATGEVSQFQFSLVDWISAGDLHLNLAFTVDRLSAIFLMVITGVGFLIHVYSTGYMHDEEDYARYFSYLNLFVFFMLLLVLGNNFVVMFAGWEGVGLCSYLLIGFWFKNNNYNNAAKKAFVMNRIGDLGFLLGMFLLFNKFGSLDYHTVFELAKSTATGDYTITAICILLFIGAMGKSAQIPLYTWLPDAMAGPTPVSALIHAATMVTAGIYMIVRSNILYTLSPEAGLLVAVVGVATALFSATIGLKQNDIKKVLAYSTVSQLGFMFAALGVGAYSTGIFHVVTHAFFKALLFLCAGSVIHAMSGEQDIRKMGNLRKKLPVTHLTFLIGTLAICGFPPFAGFFSKDEILIAVHGYEHGGIILFSLLSVTAAITAVYMFRLYWLTFWGDFRGTHHQEEHLHESPMSITVPLMILAALATLSGFMGMPEIFHAPHYLSEFLAPIISFGGMHGHASETLEISVMLGSVIGLALIIALTYKTYVDRKVVPEQDFEEQGFEKVLSHKYYIDEIYESVITKPLQGISKFINSYIEKYVIDGAVNGINWLTQNGSSALRQLQTGSIGFYVFGMVIGIVLIFVLKFLIK